MNGLSQNRAKQIRSLQQKKARKETGLFLVEGAKVVIETLKADWPKETLVCTETFFKENQTLIAEKKTEVFICTDSQLANLGSFQSNDAALLVARQKTPGNSPDEKQSLWLALEEISDPGNLGTIIRLADWFGLKQIICLGNTVEWYNPKVISSSMGSFLRVDCVQMEEADLKKTKRSFMAADMNGKNLYDFEFPSTSVLLIGNEAKGLKPGWLTKPENVVSIPSYGNAESLNAAMATGIILSHYRQQQHKVFGR